MNCLPKIISLVYFLFRQIN